MGKLHQLLAIESDAKNTMVKILNEGRKTFSQRSGHFNEERKTYQPVDEKDQDRPEGLHTPMVTTVAEKLNYLEKPVKKAFDVLLQKEQANQKAVANIEVEKGDGSKITLVENVPVTVLVQLEKWLHDLRNTYNTIPTLDPSKEWVIDDTSEHIWKASPVKTQRTKKMNETITLHPGTDKHPPQVQLVQVDKLVGYWTTEVKSGALSPKQKSRLLGKIDALITGVKIARAKANDIEHNNAQMGEAFFQFINSGLND